MTNLQRRGKKIVHDDEPEGPRALRVRLTKGLAAAIKHRSGTVVFHAFQRGPRGYTFEASGPGVIRALWIALADVHYRPPAGTGGRAVGKSASAARTALRPFIEASWPKALAE